MIGGGVIAAGELLLAPAREVVARRALPPAGTSCGSSRRAFGAEAGMIGAALLALDRGRRADAAATADAPTRPLA